MNGRRVEKRLKRRAMAKECRETGDQPMEVFVGDKKIYKTETKGSREHLALKRIL